MKILKNLNQKYSDLCNITIGVFDGIHLGHQLILKKLKEKEGKSVVITFSNHPLEIINPNINFKHIYTIEQKLKLIESFGIDLVILLKFTKKLANLDYHNFFKILKSNFSFNYFIVGEDVKLGKDNLGDQISIKNLEKLYQFKLERIKKIEYQNKIISSSWIRSLINEKNFNLVEKLLNRKYHE
jgi:riboflavin kinase / FMN adenylyltransferase